MYVYLVLIISCVLQNLSFPIVSVGFFDDMYVPLTYLPEPSAL